MEYLATGDVSVSSPSVIYPGFTDCQSLDAEYCHLRSEAVVIIPEDADPTTYAVGFGARLVCATTNIISTFSRYYAQVSLFSIA